MASAHVSRQPSEVDGSNVPTTLSGTASLSSTLNSSLHAKGSLGGASSLASKIAAFSNGVAPVKSGMVADPEEDELLIEEVMHKLEAAARMPTVHGRCELSLSIVRAAGVHLNRAKEEVARMEKELHEIRSSRVQLLPPSAWIKREHKYKMDLEKYEHTISMQAARLKEVEEQVAVLMAGDNIKPLEERIAELESQLKTTSEERTQYESKFHELSIKHRQLIETSPQVATLWQEVVGASSAAQAGQHEVDRLTKFDLRHTGKGPGGSASLSMRVAAIKEAASRGHSRSASAGGLDGLAAASSPSAASAASNTGPGTPLSTASTTQQQQEGQADGSAAPGGASHAEAAHMSSVNLEGLTPEASIAALQQLNYDLTMQLDLYQTMVTRLKDQMESVDTEKAELEADKVHLQQQLATLVGGVRGESAAGARGFGSWWRGRSRRTATTTAAAAGVGEGPSEAGEEGEWDRSTVGGDETMSVAGSLRSTLSGDLDAPRDATPRDGPAAAGPADSGSSAPAASSSSDGPDAATASSSQPAGGGAVGAVGSMAAAAGRLVGRLSRGPSASGGGGPAAGAPNPEVLSRQLREARHQAQAVAEDNKVLVSKLVESQMELADAQGAVMQYKRALVRAMDKEVELDTKVRELQNILDMLTSSPRTADTARQRAGVSEPGMLAQLAATLSERLAAAVAEGGGGSQDAGVKEGAEAAAAGAAPEAAAGQQAGAAAAGAAAGEGAEPQAAAAAAADVGDSATTAEGSSRKDGPSPSAPEEVMGGPADDSTATATSTAPASGVETSTDSTAGGPSVAAAAAGAEGAGSTPAGTAGAGHSMAAGTAAEPPAAQEAATAAEAAVISHAVVADDTTSDSTEEVGEVMAELRPASAVVKAPEQPQEQ